MKKFIFPGCLLLLFSGLLANCKKTDQQPNPFTTNLGDTIEIAYQQTATIQPGDFKVSFDSILSDSRCPSNAVCVWAGRADAKMHFTLGQITVTDTLGIGAEGAPWSPDHTTVLGYNVKLIDILPYPLDPGPIPPTDYKVKIVVTQ